MENDSRSNATIIAALATTGIVVSLMQTLLLPLLSTLPQLLDTTPGNATWAVTATLLAGAISTPVAGRLGDMYGKRRVLLSCLLLVIVGSTICATNSELIPVIVGRTLQGLGMGVVPLGISIMRDLLPAERMGFAVSVMSATMGVGGAVGLPAASLVAEAFDWHVMFWSVAILNTIVALVIYRVVPESSVRSGGRVDLGGVVGLATVLFCLLLIITKGAQWGWSSAMVVSLSGVLAVVTPTWAWWQWRARQPLVNLRISVTRPVLLTNMASLLAGFAMYGQALILPQVLQAPSVTGYGLGLSMVASGLCLAPCGLGMILVSPLSARIINTRGPRFALMLGLALIAGGYALGAFAINQVWQVVTVATVIASGVGIAFASMPTLIMRSVPIAETGAGNGLNALMRSTGTTLAGAVVGAVLTGSIDNVDSLPFPTESAFHSSFLICGAAAATACTLAAFIPRVVSDIGYRNMILDPARGINDPPRRARVDD